MLIFLQHFAATVDSNQWNAEFSWYEFLFGSRQLLLQTIARKFVLYFISFLYFVLWPLNVGNEEQFRRGTAQRLLISSRKLAQLRLFLRTLQILWCDPVICEWLEVRECLWHGAGMQENILIYKLSRFENAFHIGPGCRKNIIIYKLRECLSHRTSMQEKYSYL